MTTFLDASGAMAVRMSAALRDEFLTHYSTRTAVQHGRSMPDFVVVPADLLTRTDQLVGWLARAAR